MLEVGFSRAVVTHDEWKYIAIRYDRHNQKDLDAGKPGFPDGTRNPRFWRSHKYSSDHFPHFQDMDQLYNLKADPKEQRNLNDHPEYAHVRKKMRSKLSTELSAIPFPGSVRISQRPNLYSGSPCS
jgi:arylsulfatase A-like enzyme